MNGLQKRNTALSGHCNLASVTSALVLTALAGLGALPGTAHAADDYPNKPIRVIVPYPPGSSTDPIARLVGQRVAETFKQPMVIENRAGGNTMIGTEFVARAPADGYTLLIASAATTVNPSLYRKVNYDPIRDFTGVSLASGFPLIVHVHPSVPARNIAELIALAKAQPGKLTYGSGGIGAANHLAGEMFKVLAEIDILHVPYKGGAPALTDHLGGQVQIMFGGIQGSLPHVKSGKLRGLAVTGSERSPLAPDLPTVAASGVPGYDVTSWNGYVAPKGTPAAAVARLSTEIQRILRLPDVRDTMATQGLTPLPTTPEETNAFLLKEFTNWKRVIDKTGIKADIQ